ncbi:MULTISPECIES: aldehyde dehydrogenase family protein [unclassified Rhizobium]|uniref:aldehyde dehydrogenase family protein n=1 Tax=Rhizobium sp. BK591 TaxID=2586985 RepID=UPI001042CC75
MARCGAAEINAAVAAAKRAFPMWKAKTPEERASCLIKLADLIEAETQRLMMIDSLDIGRGFTTISGRSHHSDTRPRRISPAPSL